MQGGISLQVLFHFRWQQWIEGWANVEDFSTGGKAVPFETGSDSSCLFVDIQEENEMTKYKERSKEMNNE
jgi:hypothetical protein